jgi:hypothetical protein
MSLLIANSNSAMKFLILTFCLFGAMFFTPLVVYASDCSDADAKADSVTPTAQNASDQGNHLKSYQIYYNIAITEETCTPQDIASSFKDADSSLTSNLGWQTETKDNAYYMLAAMWQNVVTQAKFLHDAKFCAAVHHEFNAIEMTSKKEMSSGKMDFRKCGLLK